MAYTSTGYTVHCIVKDSNALSYVQFPTWTPWIKGQDDLIGHRGNISGNGKLTYSSSNNKIAMVSSNGTVTIKGIGISNITITVDGTSAYNKATKTVTVIVIPKSTTISSLKNNKSKKLTVAWKRNSSVTGYKIQVATNSCFINAKTYTFWEVSDILRYEKWGDL